MAPSTVVYWHWRRWQRPGPKLPRQCTSDAPGEEATARKPPQLPASRQAIPQGTLREWRAEERWRKPVPPCNGADRSCNITPPRKQADFQQGRALRESWWNLSTRKSKRTWTPPCVRPRIKRQIGTRSTGANLNAKSGGCKPVS